MELRERIIESAEEISSSMLMMDISAMEETKAENHLLSTAYRGSLVWPDPQRCVAIHLPEKVAIAITSSLLGMDVDEDELRCRGCSRRIGEYAWRQCEINALREGQGYKPFTADDNLRQALRVSDEQGC